MEPALWTTETDRLLDRMAGRFARVETRRRARSLVFGLLADLPQKNCWTIAEHAGDRDPHGMRRPYTGTAGRVENAQVAVYLTYAGARSHAMIDRELYLPLLDR